MCKTDAQPETKACVYCGEGGAKPVRGKNRWYQCGKCRRQFSSRHGTDRKGSRLSDEQWDLATKFFRDGNTNKADLMRLLGCTYKTALRTYERFRWNIVGADGLTKSQRRYKKLRAEGKCVHCGKPCAPYRECKERRDYKKSMLQLKRVSEPDYGKNGRKFLKVRDGSQAPKPKLGKRLKYDCPDYGIKLKAKGRTKREYRRNYYRKFRDMWKLRKVGDLAKVWFVVKNVKTKCPGCGEVWDRPDDMMRTRCARCFSAYLKEYKSKRRSGWEPDRRACKLCGEPMSPLSKRDSHPACAWWKMRSEAWEESERKIQWEREQVERPTTPAGWLLRARRELGRARAALRDQENSATPSTPARISLTSCPPSSATS